MSTTSPIKAKDVFKKIETRIAAERNLKIGAQLDPGSNGEVYIAHNPSSKLDFSFGEKYVVGKTIKGNFGDDNDKRKAYIDNELQISDFIMKNPIPGVVRVLHVNHYKHKIYMPHTGMCLIDFVKMSHVDKEFLTLILGQLTNACLELFKKGLIHRDISARNVTVDVKVQDAKVEMTFTLIDLGDCSFNPYGTRKISRKTSNPDDGYTWRTDIYYLGRLFYDLMCKTVGPAMRKEDKRTQLIEMFGDLYQLTLNMMDDDPKERPAHEEILKLLHVKTSDTVKNYSMMHFIEEDKPKATQFVDDI